MSIVGRYFHTVRHLRPTQIAGRIWYRLHSPRIDSRPPPALRGPHAAFAAPIAPEPSFFPPDTFRFLNVERRCAHAADWHPADVAKLWTYNLQYFDDLNAKGAAARRDAHRQLLDRWVRENPAPHADAWEPYPVSRRIVNWVKWCWAGNALSPACQASLAVQARWLMQRLEYHILGNHLFANGKALVFAGLCFEGAEAGHWYARGFRILSKELPEQVLPDGGHFELSPMYHAVVLEDLLDLVNALRACGREPPAEWLDAIARMQRWLRAMSHPDGEISFFSDAAFASAPAPAELYAYAARLGIPVVAEGQERLIDLVSSGYFRADIAPAVLICDCAAVGPDYLPGHAHADTLSCELSLAGRRVLVNSGTSEYGSSAERLRQRGTAAHNTVALNARNSSDVWGGFRVGQRARMLLRQARVAAEGVDVEGAHDGYRHEPGRNVHRRRWSLQGNSLSIRDDIDGACEVAEALWHLHPDIEVRVLATGGDALELAGVPGYVVRMSFEGASEVQVRRSTWHPRFGVVEPSACIVARFAGASLHTRLEWSRA